MYSQALADVRSTGAGIKYLYCTIIDPTLPRIGRSKLCIIVSIMVSWGLSKEGILGCFVIERTNACNQPMGGKQRIQTISAIYGSHASNVPGITVETRATIHSSIITGLIFI